MNMVTECTITVPRAPTEGERLAGGDGWSGRFVSIESNMEEDDRVRWIGIDGRWKKRG